MLQRLYGDEAISTIVQEMENHRKDLIVIFAGYPDKMEQFLRKNPGLRSRIAFHVPFEDYTSEELCQIAGLIARKSGVMLTEDAGEKLLTLFKAAKTEPDFGNGRFARNVIEQARMSQASRLLKMEYDQIQRRDIETICAEDIKISAPKSRRKDRSDFEKGMSTMLEIEKHPHLCPVCGKYEFQTYDWYEICPVCGWEDNAMQNEDPDCAAGPNKLSLKECRRAYLAERCGGGREIENQVKFFPT